MSTAAIIILVIISIFLLILFFWFIYTLPSRREIRIKEQCQQELFFSKMKAEQIKQEARAAEKETRSAIDRLAK